MYFQLKSQATPGAFDPRIVYPCYKSFDDFIDVERLQALDGYITERIRAHMRTGDDDYFINDHRLDMKTPQQPGVREIWLSRPVAGAPGNYLDLDKPALWEPTAAVAEFPELMDFIGTLPFKATGRMLIIYDYSGNAVPAHCDHFSTDVCNDFIWMRTSLKKPFYLLNDKTGEKRYVRSYSAWFDTVNQFHGSDAIEGLSFSMRVDGIFTDAFASRIPVPATNFASTPALWACV
jgi:hypothetical protein